MDYPHTKDGKPDFRGGEPKQHPLAEAMTKSYHRRAAEYAKNEEAKADLMKENRLTAAAHEKQAQDSAIKKDEQRLNRTQDSLSKLGAGQGYGE